MKAILKHISMVIIIILLANPLITIADGELPPIQPTGTGTASDPYLISEINNLIWLFSVSRTNSLTDVYFRQTANINISAAGNWQSIGNEVYPFKGIYNGNSYVIEGLSFCSLFYYNSGTIENLGIPNVDIWVENSGCLATRNYGTINNCYVTGTVSTDFNAGFVYENYGEISNCYFSGNVHGYGFSYMNKGHISNCHASGYMYGVYAVGLVFHNENGIINNCYTTGIVESIDIGGGLVVYNTEGMVSNCYIDTIVSGYYSSSLVIFNSGTICNSYSKSGNANQNSWLVSSNNGIIDNCFSAGTLIGGNHDDFWESAYGDGTFNNCYYLTENGMRTDYNGTITKCLKLSSQSIYQSLSFFTTKENWYYEYPWDFENTWNINQNINNGFPYHITNIQAIQYPIICADYGVYSDTQKLNGIPPAGLYNFNATYINNGEAQNTVCVIIIKNNNKIIHTYILSHDFISNEKYTYSTPINIGYNSDMQIACYLWNGLDNIKPLSSGVRLSN